MGRQQGYFGAERIEYQSITTTIEEAQELLKSKIEVEFGTTITAAHQTQGRGQRGKTWTSDHGKSLLQTIIFPRQKIDEHGLKIHYAPQFSVVLANSIVYVLKELLSAQDTIQIKWSNDILINEKKIAGILANVHNDNILLSLGLNVKAQEFDFEDSSYFQPASLSDFGVSLDVDAAYQKISTTFEKEAKKPLDEIFTFTNSVLWKRGEVVSFRKSSEAIISQTEKVTVKHIDTDGRLVVLKNGVEELKQSGTIISSP